jgi:hypothetical protein
MPKRIQLRRQKGWRKPAGSVVVARPSRWGNPFKIGENLDRVSAIAAFRAWLLDSRRTQGPSLSEIRCALRDDLACWCSLDEPCHADVLLEIANA